MSVSTLEQKITNMKKKYLLIISSIISIFSYSQTVWTGPTITFTKAAFVDPELPANQDRITDSVWLTRANTQGLFNIFKEISYTGISPINTEWAMGTIDNYATLTYTNWLAWFTKDGKDPNKILNQNAVLHIISDDIYIPIKFLSWGQSTVGGGSFSYERSTAGPMAVSLINFTATVYNNSAVVAWKTAEEINNSHFQVEHSTNGFSFSPAGIVTSAGNSGIGHSYNYTYLGLTAGNHYFRLAQYDFNGEVSYSKVVLVTFKGDQSLTIFPNPVGPLIHLQSQPPSAGSHYLIVSNGGQTIKRGIVSGFTINVNKLAPGNYWLITNNKEGVTSKTQFLKK